MNQIPLVDLHAQYEDIRAELDEAVGQVLQTSAFVGGDDHAQFASEFADWCGGGHVSLVGNGTDALTLALVEKLGRGDGTEEVITTSHTFVATTEAIVNAGYRPVLTDIEQDTCLMSTAAIKAAITDASVAVIPVHLYGQMVDMKRVRTIAERHDLAVIEDAAQAHGSSFDGIKPGQLGDAACFSFYPGKNLGAWGDGGAVFSRDEELVQRISHRANHGRSSKYLHDMQGENSRLDGLQAAVLRVKLCHLDRWNDARRAAAARYDDLLANQPGIVLPATAPGATHVFHLYVVQVDDRDCVREALNAQGIGAGVHYPVPVHEQPAFAGLGYAPGDLPVSSLAASRVLSLPLYPEITTEQIERVCEALIAQVRG